MELHGAGAGRGLGQQPRLGPLPNDQSAAAAATDEGEFEEEGDELMAVFITK